MEGNQSAYNVLCNHENGKNHLHKWAKIRKYAPKNINTRKDVLYNCENGKCTSKEYDVFNILKIFKRNIII